MIITLELIYSENIDILLKMRCSQCGIDFELSASVEYLVKIGLTPNEPALCPKCQEIKKD